MSENELGFMDRIKYLFSAPSLFFEKVKREQGIKHSLLMFLAAGTFLLIIPFGIPFWLNGLIIFPSKYIYQSNPHLPFLSEASFLLGILLVTFVYSGFVHAFIVGYKGTGTFASSFNVFAYSTIPLLFCTPFLSLGFLDWYVLVAVFLGMIYSTYLIIIGLAEVHNISKGKAALALLFSTILLIVLLLGLAFLALMWPLSRSSGWF